MRLHHFGCAMNQIFGPLTVFHTHNYADNYSPEILQLHDCGDTHPAEESQRNGVQQPIATSQPPVTSYIQNVVMPTLQKMHLRTAASPRSTAKFFLLMEELSYRHLYRVDQAWLLNFARARHSTEVHKLRYLH